MWGYKVSIKVKIETILVRFIFKWAKGYISGFSKLILKRGRILIDTLVQNLVET